MATQTIRITGADSKQYDLTYELVPATLTPATVAPATLIPAQLVPAVLTPAVLTPESWRFVSMAPVEAPPPPPPPPVNTSGLITNFSAISGTSTTKIGGQSTKNLNANATSNNGWSVKQIDDYTLRYEVRSGDLARAANGWVDSSTSERSETELMPRYGDGVTINISYGFILHAGSPNTSQWVVIGQCHVDGTSGVSPPFSFALFGEKLTVICRGPSNAENRVYTDPNPIQRERKYKMRVELKFNGNGTGTCKVWRDDVQIVNFSGALGGGSSGETHYFKQGIYRNRASETMAASYSNLSVTAS